MTTLDFQASDFIAAPEHGLLTTSVMPVIHLKGDVARGVGTCFAISNDGLCLTARHVVEEALRDVFPHGQVDAERDGWLYVVYGSDEPNGDIPERPLGGLLPVQFIHSNDVLDIAGLQLQLPRHTVSGKLLPMPVQKLGLAPPALGEVCFALGYHSMQWELREQVYHVNQRFYASRGTVQAIHVPQRDAVMAPFPCFQTSARYDGGMSGGPIVGMDGLVRGVVCSSMNGLSDEEGYISYASLVGPAALLPVTRGDDQGVIGKCFLNDLIEGGSVFADYQGVSVERLGSVLQLTIGGSVISSTLGS